MRSVTIHLDDELFRELETAAAETSKRHFPPEAWAAEAVESVLASRRLPRFTKAESRPQMTRNDHEPHALVEHRVVLPALQVARILQTA